jgi:hypothetical protein
MDDRYEWYSRKGSMNTMWENVERGGRKESRSKRVAGGYGINYIKHCDGRDLMDCRRTRSKCAC